MSALALQPIDQPTSSQKGADQQQLVVASGTSVEAANRSVVLSETEEQLEMLELDTQHDQKKKSDACADEGEEIKKFFKLAELGGAAKMRAMLKGPNANVLLSAKVNGVTALSVAAQEGNAKVVELLNEKGAMDVKSPAVTFGGGNDNTFWLHVATVVISASFAPTWGIVVVVATNLLQDAPVVHQDIVVQRNRDVW
ncbi:hypothetical protein GPALN_005839 [Globodera pallida]|nr:hypothetical protein GPALN_005839 [Globodera pallida]